MRTTLVAGVLALAISSAPSAHAADKRPVDDMASERHWYGAPILIADAAAAGAILASVYFRSDTLIGAGLVSFAGVPPVVHALHRRGGRGLGSLGLRLGLPIVGAFIGGGLVDRSKCHIEDDGCVLAGVLTGAGIGMALAAIADQFLAFDRHETRAKPSAFAIAPTLSVGRTGGSVGLAGAF
jgi:hypothetical protein